LPKDKGKTFAKRWRYRAGSALLPAASMNILNQEPNNRPERSWRISEGAAEQA